jgi:hypothetical protein
MLFSLPPQRPAAPLPPTAPSAPKFMFRCSLHQTTLEGLPRVRNPTPVAKAIWEFNLSSMTCPLLGERFQLTTTEEAHSVFACQAYWEVVFQTPSPTPAEGDNPT